MSTMVAQAKEVEVVNTVEVRGETWWSTSTGATSPRCSSPPRRSPSITFWAPRRIPRSPIETVVLQVQFSPRLPKERVGQGASGKNEQPIGRP